MKKSGRKGDSLVWWIIGLECMESVVYFKVEFLFYIY